MPRRTETSATIDPTPRRQPLTRERIIATACRLMDQEGLEAVTMRRIGRELGVEAMSLYNHVEDKEDILAGICELVLSGFRYPDPSQSWTQTVSAGAHEWRRLLRTHPNVIRLFAETRKMAGTVEALGPMNFALGVFHQAGLRGQDIVKAFRVFGGYIQGFVMMEVGPIFGGDDPEHVHAHHEAAAAIPADALPHLAAAFPHFHDCDPDEQFDYGLELLIEGLAAKTAQASD
jgi:AcrR family transcriptional regulator